MNANELQIKYLPIGALKDNDRAPRTHNGSQRRKLAAGVRRFGQIAPIIVDDQNVIIDGHAVRDAVRDAGHDEIAVVVVRNRDPAEVRAIRLALNRIAADAKWDEDKLRIEFQDLIDLGFDMELTGFDAVEIDVSLSIGEVTSGEVEDPPPEPEATPPITRPGDIWIMGDHHVACGDCRDTDMVTALFGAAEAQMMFSDPPYNVQIDGFVAGRGRHREFAFASGEMSSQAFTAFLEEFLSAAGNVMRDGAIGYVCMDWRHLPELLSATERAKLALMNLCVWAKTNAGMGSFYRSQHELVLVLKKGDAPHINNFELGQKGRSRSNLWSYRGMNAFGADRDQLLRVHPTVKPVALVADAIKDVSRRNDIVFDPFLGSGTTLIAAHRTGRRCRGLEIDPAYVDVVVRRWQAETGHEAVHAETGESFEDRRLGQAPSSTPADAEPAGLGDGAGRL